MSVYPVEHGLIVLLLRLKLRRIQLYVSERGREKERKGKERKQSKQVNKVAYFQIFLVVCSTQKSQQAILAGGDRIGAFHSWNETFCANYSIGT